MTIDATVHAPTQPVCTQHTPSTDAAQRTQNAAAGDASTVSKAAAADAAPTSRPVAGPQLGAAQAELTWLQRRFGDGLQLQSPADFDSAAAPSVAAGQHDASRQAHQQSVQDAQAGAVQLTVRLLPTDPGWDCGPLRLCIRLADTYPAAHSVEVLSVKPCQQCGDSKDSRADDGGAQAALSSCQQAWRRCWRSC